MGKNAKDKRDIYYRLAKQKQYRSRSAFKLIQINQFFELFEKLIESEDIIVDLCSAPGGWSQVCSNYINKTNNKNTKINDSDLSDINKQKEFDYVVAIDVQKMQEVEGVHFIQGDITNQETLNQLKKYSNNKKVRMVISDGAPDITCDTEFDLFVQHQLVYYALSFAINVLSHNGVFIAKIYKGKHIRKTLEIITKFFKKVSLAKPKSCRNASFEAFIVCEGFLFGDKEEKDDNSASIKELFTSNSLNIDSLLNEIRFDKCKTLLKNKDDKFLKKNIDMKSDEDLKGEFIYKKVNIVDGVEKEILFSENSLLSLGIELIQVGDENFDSDKTYDLNSTNYDTSLNPTQMPIDPPYKAYCNNIKGVSQNTKTIYK